MEINEITEAIIGAAIDVHRGLGPGLLESAYQQCLRYELALRKISYEYELPLPVVYKDIALECGYRLDLVVLKAVVVEVKSVQSLDRYPNLLRSSSRICGWAVLCRPAHQLQRGTA